MLSSGTSSFLCSVVVALLCPVYPVLGTGCVYVVM